MCQSPKGRGHSLEMPRQWWPCRRPLPRAALVQERLRPGGEEEEREGSASLGSWGHRMDLIFPFFLFSPDGGRRTNEQKLNRPFLNEKNYSDLFDQKDYFFLLSANPSGESDKAATEVGISPKFKQGGGKRKTPKSQQPRFPDP